LAAFLIQPRFEIGNSLTRSQTRATISSLDELQAGKQSTGTQCFVAGTDILTRDGLRTWRIDYDPNDGAKGFHINWQVRKGPKRSDGWYRGAIKVENANQDHYWEIINRFPRKDNFIGGVE
jgi:hypothetical protein